MIGEGGMGRVFRAQHRISGRLAAIKIVGDSRGLAEANWELRSEVQAHASLVHPNIVYLLDYGEVVWDSDEAQPYVIMEFAELGTLRTNSPMDWNSLRNVIIDVLKALAFAHARGVIHRDLKPENLLLFQNRVVKLADFGIARTFGWKRDLHSRQVIAGTPQYMAPEQIAGYWRESGPWTDIYALGCVVWEMVCGRAPFHGENVMADVLLPHLRSARPRLDARFEVPKALDSWVKKAMAIQTGHRFRCAAEALHALPEPGESSGSAGTEWLVAQPTVKWFASTTPLDIPTLTFEPGLSLPSSAEFESSVVPDFPTDWRQEESNHDSEHEGIGLFGIREPPFVGREAERDSLWQALGLVLRNRNTLAIHIEGDEGSGKSRIIHWLAERALELGVARVFRASHSQSRGLGNGIVGMVIRHLNAWGEERDSLKERLGRIVPNHSAGEVADSNALLGLIFPEEDAIKSYWDNVDNRIRLLGRIVSRFTESEPTIFILDDIHLSVETMKWLRHFLTAFPNLPFLFVTTAVHHVTGESEEGKELNALRALETIQTLELSPLSAEEHFKLVSRLLRLNDDLARTIAERSEGHPQFAVQMLADLIEKDALRSTDASGHDLRQTFEVTLPHTIQEVWIQRLERLVQAYPNPEEIWRRIEVAATLGRDVGNAEWVALNENDLSKSTMLRDDIVERGLAQRRPEGWSFSHRLLVESILVKSKDEGRLEENHIRCAELLEILPYFSGRDGRVADHWIESGVYSNAWDPLERERDRLRRVGTATEVRSVLERQIWLADTLGLGPADPGRLGAEIFRGYYELMFQRDAKASRLALEKLLKLSTESGRSQNIVRVTGALADCYLMLGEITEAVHVSRIGLQAAMDEQDPVLLASAHDTSGWLLHMAGRNVEAKVHLEQSLHLKGDDYSIMVSSVVLSYVLLALGDIDEARTILKATIERAEELGFRVLVGDAFNTLGEVERFASNHETSQACYLKSIDIRREMGRSTTMVELNLELLKCSRGDTAGVFRFIDDHRSILDSHEALEKLLVLLSYANNEMWIEFQNALDEVETELIRSPRLERDHPWILSLCVAAAKRSGERAIEERLTRMVDALETRIRS